MVFLTLKPLLRHIRLSHSDQECFTIQCNFQGCCRTFQNLRTFENHIYAYHNVSEVRNVSREEESGSVMRSDNTIVRDSDDTDDSEAEITEDHYDQLRGEVELCKSVYNIGQKITMLMLQMETIQAICYHSVAEW